MAERTLRAGQVWASRDRRDNGREVRVVALEDDVVLVRSVRLSRMRRSTLLGRYRLIRDVPAVVTVTTAGGLL